LKYRRLNEKSGYGCNDKGIYIHFTGEEIEAQYRENTSNENEQVYIWDRKIPKDIVYGSSWGSFEIHFDIKLRKVLSIYLVA